MIVTAGTPIHASPATCHVSVMALGVIAVLATLVHLCFNQAIKEADLTVLLPFNFASLIWAAIIGYLVFAEMPTIWTWVGGAIIFISGTYLVIRESRLSGAPGAAPSAGA